MKVKKNSKAFEVFVWSTMVLSLVVFVYLMGYLGYVLGSSV